MAFDMTQNLYFNLANRLFLLVVAGFILFFQVTLAQAAPCDLKPTPPPFIRHDLNPAITWCELCGYGYVTIEIRNPYEGANMINMSIVENLLTSGLTFDPTAPTPLRVNGVAMPASSYPNISGLNGSLLTWPTTKFSALSLLAASAPPNNFPSLRLTFAVRRSSTVNQEGLRAASKQIRASLSYSTTPLCTLTSPVSTGLDLLPFREPNLTITKGGRNVDAGQPNGSYPNTLFGTNNDDVIWRVRLNNTSLVAMQDLRLDDVMPTDRLRINYACPTEPAAVAVANNNGVAPAGSSCVNVTANNNNNTNFIVSGLFSNPDNTIFDVAASNVPTDIYFVGKLRNNVACNTILTDRNVVSNVSWGCEVDPPAGGITTSPTANAQLRTNRLTNNLTITANLTGIATNPRVGSKGLMRLTIRNATSGAVRNIRLRDILPPEYVVDSTAWGNFNYVRNGPASTTGVSITVTPGSGGIYSGMVNTLVWTNPQAGTVPLTTTNPNVPTLNTAPEFSLLSTTANYPMIEVNTGDPNQFNMLRQNDVVEIRFPVVLVKVANYDTRANLDITLEDPSNNTDPLNKTTTLANTLTYTFEDFCTLSTLTISPPAILNNFTADPEDFDIDIWGWNNNIPNTFRVFNPPNFILQTDPLPPAPPVDPLYLGVRLTNNGGHTARNYYVYVTFGATMQVLTAPNGCVDFTSSIASDPIKLWSLPAPPPASATVYRCTPPMSPQPLTSVLPLEFPRLGQANSTVFLEFQVRKVRSSDLNGGIRIDADDLTFRADVVGEIFLTNPPPLPNRQELWFPAPLTRSDGLLDRANNYSLDGIRARVLGFSLFKNQLGNCTENPLVTDSLVQIGEDCNFHIESGNWFGFLTPGYTYIAVQNVTLTDELPNGQGYISSTDPALTSSSQIISTPLPTAQTSPPLNPLDEGFIDWRFNTVGPLANRITLKDQVFRVDVTNRILNDPINVVNTLPNRHAEHSINIVNSTFEAVFNNSSTLLDETFVLGPTTIGYPSVNVRRVDLTVTEPRLLVVKTVCNETLSLTGIGDSCTPFLPIVSNGDTFDSYVYRIAVTNEAAATNGVSPTSVTRAPAYDVVVTSTLDPSDLERVIPFNSDLLNNDADLTADPTDASEGAISENIINSGGPAVLTFSYTHSTALQRINAGATVNLYYRVDPDQTVQPSQSLVNSVTASYDSLTGVSGNQSTVAQPGSGTMGGARIYTTVATSATLRVIDPIIKAKKILELSQVPIHATPVSSGNQGVSIGEEIRYELPIDLPIANLRNFIIRDDLPTGLHCSAAPAVTLPTSAFFPGGTFTPHCVYADSYVEWNFGNQALIDGTGITRYPLAVNFTARVENSLNTNNGNIISNGGVSTVGPASVAKATYDTVLTFGGPVVPVTLLFPKVDIQIQEPKIELTKTITTLPTTDAGDQVLVTITATNTGTATAYNLRVVDDLTLTKLQYVGSVGGTGPPDSVDVSVTNRPIFIWNSIPAGAGNSRQLTFIVSLNSGVNGVQPNEVISNTVQGTWDSLAGQSTSLVAGGIGANGSDSGLRNGSASPVLNDYHTTASASFTLPAVDMSKTDKSPGVVATIGALKQFQVIITFPEGSTKNVVLTDNLASGTAGYSYHLENVSYTFENITSPVAITSPALNSTGTVTWNIGDVVTASENDNAATPPAHFTPRILIDYDVRIFNDAVTQDGGSLRNSASLTYLNGSKPAQFPTAVTVLEPLVTLTKVVSTETSVITPPTAVQKYTLVLTADSVGFNSAAFDAAITETLAAGLVYVPGSASFAVAGGASVSGSIVPDVSTPQVLKWNLSNGNNIDIPVGGSVTLTYEATFPIATSLLSTSLVQWTSLNDTVALPLANATVERDGSNTPTYNDYFTSISVNTPAFPDTTDFTKTRDADTFVTGDDSVRIGDVVDFRLSVRLSEGTTLSSTIVDTLPRGLEFVSVQSVNGDTSAPYTSAGAPFAYPAINAPTVSGTASTGTTTVTWTLGDITNSVPNSFFDIVYRVRVLNGSALAQLSNIELRNSAIFNYIHANTTGITRSALVNVKQPNLIVSKTVAVSPNTTTTVAVGEIVTYTIDISNIGTIAEPASAPAYDVLLTDVIPLELRNGASTILPGASVSLIVGAVTTPLTNIVSYNTGTNTATWDFDPYGAVNPYTIPVGGILRIVYSVTAYPGLGAGTTITNQAVVSRYCTFDNDDIPLNISGDVNKRKCYSVAPASATISSAAATPLTKTNTQTTAAIGEQFKYRITLPAPLTRLNDVQIFDDLAAASGVDMSYVTSSTINVISGPAGWIPKVTGTTSIVITNTDAGGLAVPLDIPAGQAVDFEITVVLKNNTTLNTLGKAFRNTAYYTYNRVDGDNSTVTTTSNSETADMHIIGPGTIIMSKDGPTTLSVGTAGSFILDVHNNVASVPILGRGTAWDMTIVDRLPILAQGGMCDTAPTITSVLNDGVALAVGTDYTAIFTPATLLAPNYCTLTFTMKGGIAADKHLIINYQASLNTNTLGGLDLINVAAATQWFSADDTVANVASAEIHTYTGPITDGTPTVTDNQDAQLVRSEAPTLQFLKSVQKLTSSGTLVSGATAIPGDLLRYTLVIRNQSSIPLNGFSLTDELDRLNAVPVFVPGSLVFQSIPAGATTTFSNASGGSKGTGLVDIRNLSITAQGGANDTLTIVFDARLASVITNGTEVKNQAQLPISIPSLDSDDPAVNGTHDPSLAIPGPIDPTLTLITSAPILQVRKTSLDISGDPLVLLAGERLRYTITVKNIGNENARGVTLRDELPANTSYVPGTTFMNGVLVNDVGTAPALVSALQGGLTIRALDSLNAGDMRADASNTFSNIATITFEVQINSNVLNATIISNQGFVNGIGQGSGAFIEKPSDDPATTTADDPTRNIVGNFPLLNVQKTVAIQLDNNADNIVNPLDTLRYTITISNLAAIPATGVVFNDVMAGINLLNTNYLPDTVTLNGAPAGQPDGGISPLIAGLAVNAPNSAIGTIPGQESAVITFDVAVDTGVATGTVISNQGTLNSVELLSQLTDADGNSSNGDQPTTIVVGTAQQVQITKQVAVVGGGAALAGGQLEYLVRVTNTGTVTANSVVLTDNLSAAPVLSQISYVANSATLNGSSTGVTVTGTLNGLSVPVTVTGAVITATVGDLLPGASTQLRFRVLINANLALGTTITNTGEVRWNTPVLSAVASVSIDVGGVPGSAKLNGHAWHDANFNRIADPTELVNLVGWTVDIYRGTALLGTTITDTAGLFSFSGLTPTAAAADQFSLTFTAPGAVITTAKMGRADSVFTNGQQSIGGITALSGSNIQNLNLPITPNGVVYNSILRSPAVGAILTMVTAGSNAPLLAVCFNDPAQQGQVTLASGYYKFDLNFGDASCQPGGDFLIQVASPAAFNPGTSLIIPPQDSTIPYSVPVCSADRVPATGSHCEVQISELAPPLSIPAADPRTEYYLRMNFSNTAVVGDNEIFNNHIALDPRLDSAISISKVSSLQNVTKGQIVPYTITVTNTLEVPLTNMSIVDTFPPGFKYVAGSGRLDGLRVEPTVATHTVSWDNLTLAMNTKRVFQLLLIVGSGVKEGKYVNSAQAFNAITAGPASPVATATVRVIPDPTLDCSDVIGKVFDDANLNGYQDDGEKGLPGIRVVTAKGLIVTADKFGRFHITCAVVPDPDRGSNFIIKLDDRTLPSGYRLTTENPRVQRATRGKLLKFNFGAAIHKVVKLDLAEGVFEPNSTKMRVQWTQRVDLLIDELKKSASVLRLSYLAEIESEKLVSERIETVKRDITKKWQKQKGGYDLSIETEVFWRTGSPPEKSVIK
jgi:large repetitive protein